MTRYRKVEVKTYSDEKFRKLSSIPPCGQGLWLYLITGPHTTSLPGLFRAGRAALAEELGWPVDAFDKAFAELFKQGLAKADWDNRVVWIPSAIEHNAPASPNVVIHWRAELEFIPECELKLQAVQKISETLSRLKSSFAQAFASPNDPSSPGPKTSSKPSPKASQRPLPIQKQEQEQQQKQEGIEPLARSALLLPAPFIALPLNDGFDFPISQQQVTDWELLYPAIDVRQQIRNYKGWSDANPIKRKTRRGILASVNSWLAKSQDNSSCNRNGGANGTVGEIRSRQHERLQRQIDELAKAGVQLSLEET